MHDAPIQPAERSALLGFSDIVKIRNRVLEMRARGMRVIQLEGGEPFMPTPTFIKDAMKQALDADHTRYAPSSGIPELVRAIHDKLSVKNGINVSPDHLIVTAGGLHALFCAFQATVNPGDEVLFFSPYWTPIRDLVTYSGGQPVTVSLDELRGDGDLRAAIERGLTPRTRLIYVNTPANPTGDVFTRRQLEAIADVAKAKNLIVISDEAYEDLVYDGEHLSIASLPDMVERTVSCYTLSKSFSMTGWRVGYLAAPLALMEMLRKLVLNSVNGVSTPTQWAAVAAMRHDPHFFAPVRAEYRKRRDLLVTALQKAGIDCPAPAGAFYVFPNIRGRFGNDSWSAMEQILDRASIASVPGVVFGPEGEGHLRMSYSTSLELLEEAAASLAKL
ncbi:MAG: pyridoxal phosphate-dependent aminotransferase [Thermoanaerobaculia bacterium]